MTDSLKFSLKFKTPRKPIPSKLLYVDEELLSDPEEIYKSHVKRSVYAGAMGSLHVKGDTWKETEQYTSLIPPRNMEKEFTS